MDRGCCSLQRMLFTAAQNCSLTPKYPILRHIGIALALCWQMNNAVHVSITSQTFPPHHRYKKLIFCIPFEPCQVERTLLNFCSMMYGASTSFFNDPCVCQNVIM